MIIWTFGGFCLGLFGFIDAERTESANQAIENGNEEEYESRHASPLRTIEALFKAFTTATSDGRILVQAHNVRVLVKTNRNIHLT